jgi:hypothetical protein
MSSGPRWQVGDRVRFAHEHPSGPVRVISQAIEDQADPMVEIEGMTGQFGARLFFSAYCPDEEGDRQLILLAIAELALSRPGFDDTLGRIAARFGGGEMFRGFKRSNADRVKASHGPFGFAPDLEKSPRRRK